MSIYTIREICACNYKTADDVIIPFRGSVWTTQFSDLCATISPRTENDPLQLGSFSFHAQEASNNHALNLRVDVALHPVPRLLDSLFNSHLVPRQAIRNDVEEPL